MRAPIVLALAGLAATACGDEVPHGGVPRAPEASLARRVEPADLLPADLDLVVRIDLGRLRAGLGAPAIEALARRMPGEPILQRALARADAVTVGLRADDLEAGDRVVVVEGASAAEEEPDPARFAPSAAVVDQVRAWDTTASAPPRAAVARVMRVERRALVFVTALFVDSTGRVLREGTDAQRGRPFAEGLVSVDWRPRALRPSLAKRYPSIAGVLRGVSRLRATAVVADGGVQIDAQIETEDDPAAQKVARFLELLRENAGERDAAALGGMRIDAAGSAVHVAWTVPAELVLRALADEDEVAPAGPQSPD